MEDKIELPNVKKKVNFEVNRNYLHTEQLHAAKDVDNDPNKYVETSVALDDIKSLSINNLSGLTENIGYIDEGRELTDRTSMATEIVTNIINTMSCGEKDVENSSNSVTSNTTVKDAVFADVHIQNIIKKFDEQDLQNYTNPVGIKPKVYPRSVMKKINKVPQRPDLHKKPIIPARPLNEKQRGRLDKSHSTPAYDLTLEDNLLVEKLLIESKCAGM